MNRYGWVIRTRPDLIWLHNHPPLSSRSPHDPKARLCLVSRVYPVPSHYRCSAKLRRPSFHGATRTCTSRYLAWWLPAPSACTRGALAARLGPRTLGTVRHMLCLDPRRYLRCPEDDLFVREQSKNSEGLLLGSVREALERMGKGAAARPPFRTSGAPKRVP